MASTNKALNDGLRTHYMRKVCEFLEEEEEVLVVGSNELAIPVVDAEGNEKWVVFSIKVPSGSRDGDAYDGYAMAQDYEMKQTEKAEKAKAKAEKAEKDKAKRAKSAKAEG